MITEVILHFLSFIPMALLDGMDALNLDISMPLEVAKGVGQMTYALFYIFPVAALMPIIRFSLAINGLQIAWAMGLRIKSFIPTMGA